MVTLLLTVNSLLSRNYFSLKIAICTSYGFKKLASIFLTGVNYLELSLKFGVHDFMFSQFDAKLLNPGIKYGVK